MTIVGTLSFVFGSLLDNICCCTVSAAKKAVIAKILILFLFLGATAGGIVGKL